MGKWNFIGIRYFHVDFRQYPRAARNGAVIAIIAATIPTSVVVLGLGLVLNLNLNLDVGTN